MNARRKIYIMKKTNAKDVGNGQVFAWDYLVLKQGKTMTGFSEIASVAYILRHYDEKRLVFDLPPQEVLRSNSITGGAPLSGSEIEEFFKHYRQYKTAETQAVA